MGYWYPFMLCVYPHFVWLSKEWVLGLWFHAVVEVDALLSVLACVLISRTYLLQASVGVSVGVCMCVWGWWNGVWV